MWHSRTVCVTLISFLPFVNSALRAAYDWIRLYEFEFENRFPALSLPVCLSPYSHFSLTRAPKLFSLFWSPTKPVSIKSNCTPLDHSFCHARGKITVCTLSSPHARTHAHTTLTEHFVSNCARQTEISWEMSLCSTNIVFILQFVRNFVKNSQSNEKKNVHTLNTRVFF